MRYIGYQENQVRGTFGFPIQLYYVDANHPQYEMPFHWHMECELILVLDGKLQLTINGTAYTLQKGQSAFIPGEFIHGGVPESCIYECVVFDIERFLAQSPQCLEKYTSALDNGDVAEMIFDGSSKCGQIIDELFVNMEKEGSNYTFTTTGLLWQFIGELLEQKAPHSTDDFDTVYRKNKQIKRVLTKIRNDYSKPLTLDDLAREAHLNSQYFCRAFKELTGKSPIDYLNYYRIECAAEQLRLPDLSITEIALSCGFNDLSYFNRMFKRRKNMTPSQYRNKII
ncbi:AraC family transcriptional regulator [Eubacterium coprostanoligenes]|uniref:AraC family transcriptional regulator n=1 Tax=Eubacterium coprostanoligenes TaxID=290054 RepID=UPI002A834190|nr:AraC family transcriptional regulator [Eubacterium coprostanoligenes]MDY4698505.1 AraC family transcriptional regulator [Eubacterium coprostanoligenes]